jgi:hypothetical protein
VTEPRTPRVGRLAARACARTTVRAKLYLLLPRACHLIEHCL